MKILTINAGSSSLKFEIFNGKSPKSICHGTIDGIGLKRCLFETKWNNQIESKKIKIKTHKQALKTVFTFLIEKQIIDSLKEIEAIGHRVVHGGEKHKSSTIINQNILKTIKQLSELAPLHNPANIEGIQACRKLLRKTPNIAVFDTAFHQTIPEHAYLYGLPYSFYKKLKIRRYGFHGINHQYVTKLINEKLKNIHNLKNTKIISCHLGNGASIAASINGKCIDTSMGFTPLEGLVMGTRCGDIDPAIVSYLMEKKHWNTNKIDQILNTKSGLKGISETSSDMRDLYADLKLKRTSKKHQSAKRAMDIFSYRITKYIGAYAAAMGGIDALIFTAGIGEKAWYLRQDICKTLDYLGIKLDTHKNKKSDFTIHKKTSKVKTYVIEANEELQIAKEVIKTLNKTS